MSLSECDRPQCRNPWISSFCGTRVWLCGQAVAQCLPLLLLSQMWKLVYLGLIEALEILPWHVSMRCCPLNISQENGRENAQGSLQRQSSCMWGRVAEAQQLSPAAQCINLTEREGLAVCQVWALVLHLSLFASLTRCSSVQGPLGDSMLHLTFLAGPPPLKHPTSSARGPSQSFSVNRALLQGCKHAPKIESVLFSPLFPCRPFPE